MTIIIREEGKAIYYLGPYLVYAKSPQDAKEQVKRWHVTLDSWTKDRNSKVSGSTPKVNKE